MSKAACEHEMQVLGRQPAELAFSSYLLLQSSLPRMAARVCFLLENGRRLPPALNSLMVKTDVHFLHSAKATQVGCTTACAYLCFGFEHASARPGCRNAASLLAKSLVSACIELKQACNG